MGILTANLQVLEADEGLSGIRFVFSAASTYEHGCPPRIAWVPTTDTWDTAQPVEPGYRSVKTRNATIEAHLWGANYDQAEAMLHNLVSALHKHFPCVHSIQPAKWLQLAKDPQMGMGWVVVLPIVFEIPVLDVPVDTTVFSVPTTPVSQPDPDATPVTIEHGDIVETDFQ